MIKIRLTKDMFGYCIVGYHDLIEKNNTLTGDEIEKIKNVMCTKRRPSTRKTITILLDSIKGRAKISESVIKYIRREMVDRMEKLNDKTKVKLEKLFDDVAGLDEIDKEVTEQFSNTVWDIYEYSRWSIDTITKALFNLYKEIGYLHPFNDLKNDYLTVNKGRKIKEIMIYGDSSKYVGVVVGSGRLIDEKEIEKEIL